jgi:CRP/FNR family transcriptional regulator/CRP/FNR family cyclic AMP-dependent transcriptional regulator
MNREVEVLFSSVPLFSSLTQSEIAAVSRIMIVKSFNEGEVIVHEEDEENQTFFVILAGRAYVAVVTSEGKQTILATLKKNDFFGEMAILDGEPRSASVIAAEKCKLCMLYRREFFNVLERHPKIAIQMLVTMSRRLRRTNRQINTLSLMSVYGRVADVILRMAEEQGEKRGEMTMIANRPTHQIIAEMAGTSRETVSRILSQLQKKKYILLDRKKLVILNEEKLYY